MLTYHKNIHPNFERIFKLLNHGRIILKKYFYYLHKLQIMQTSKHLKSHNTKNLEDYINLQNQN